jgi:nitrogen regulatory protein P-II 1
MSDTLTKVATIKKLEIIIRPGKLDAVKKALAAAGYTGVTISQAEGQGNQKGATHAGYRMDMMSKLRLEIVVPEADVEKMIDAVSQAARTGEPGDGKIFISDIQDVVRIRTGERGAKAL